MKQPKAKPSKRPRKEAPKDDFISVARRLGADEDKERFEATLGRIARAKSPEQNPKKAR